MRTKRNITGFLDSTMLNKYVRKVLEKNVIGLYTLDKEGQERVYASNRDLKADYVEGHAHYIHQYWFKSIKRKLVIAQYPVVPNFISPQNSEVFI